MVFQSVSDIFRPQTEKKLFSEKPYHESRNIFTWVDSKHTLHRLESSTEHDKGKYQNETLHKFEFFCEKSMNEGIRITIIMSDTFTSHTHEYSVLPCCHINRDTHTRTHTVLETVHKF